MGNCEINFEPLNNPYDGWREISKDEYSTTLVNKYDQQQTIQKWISNELQNQSIYQWRLNEQNPALPKLQKVGTQANFNGSKFNRRTIRQVTYVLTKPYTKFLQSPQITKQNFYLIVKSLLSGLRILCEKFGWFQIHSNMIFFTQAGNYVIWIHRNLAVNKPQQPLSHQSYRQQYLIQRLFEILSMKFLYIPYSQIRGLNFKKTQLWIESSIHRDKYENKFNSFIQLAKNEKQEFKFRNTKILLNHQQLNPQVQRWDQQIQTCAQSVIVKKMVESRDPDKLLFKLIQEHL